MTDTDRASDALRAFGEACGLLGLDFDEDGVAGLEVGDNQVTFFLRETPVPHILIMTLITRLDPGDVSSPRILMRTNFASWFSGAMTVGLDDDGAVVGAATVPTVAANGETLAEFVRGLVSVAEKTRQALHQPDPGTQTPVTIDHASTPMA